MSDLESQKFDEQTAGFTYLCRSRGISLKCDFDVRRNLRRPLLGVFEQISKDQMLTYVNWKSSATLRGLAIVFCFAVFQLQTHFANAGMIVQAPEGLNPGDQFRIIFVTSGTIDATSNNLADYNNFVNSEAQGATYNGQKINWSAIVSTDAVNALMNTHSYSSSAIYMADGTKVSNAYSETTRGDSGSLWSSDLLAQPDEGIDGTKYKNRLVWTGTAGNGSEYSTSIFGAYGVGTSNYGTNPFTGVNTFSTPHVQVGFISASQTGSNWIQIPNISATNTPGLQTQTNQYQIYGISDVMTVATIPEPSALLSSIVGIAVVAFIAALRGTPFLRQSPGWNFR